MWHHYLKAAKQEFEVWNNHANCNNPTNNIRGAAFHAKCQAICIEKEVVGDKRVVNSILLVLLSRGNNKRLE